MPGPMGRRNRGPAQKVENSGQVLKRLFGIIFKKYKFQMIIVFVCILISVLANVQGSLFIQNLIDDYITPMIRTDARSNFKSCNFLCNRCSVGVYLRQNYGLCNTGYNA